MRYGLTTHHSVPVFANNFFDEFLSRSASYIPAVDIMQKDSTYMLKMDIPGFEQKDVAIEFENDTLTIKGKKVEEKIDDAEKVFCKERNQSDFERIFKFKNVDGEKIEAKYTSGVLIITLPLKEEVKSKKIAIALN